MLARHAVQKRSFVVMTTHSSAIIREAGERNLRFLYRQGPHSKLSKGKPIQALLETVGIDAKFEAVVCVEDRGAQFFAERWLSHFDPTLASNLEFKPMGGAGNIIRLLEAFPHGVRSIQIRALFDGDQKGKVSTSLEPTSAFLPLESVEETYRTMVGDDPDRFANVIGRDNIPELLFAIRQYENHDLCVRHRRWPPPYRGATSFDPVQCLDRPYRKLRTCQGCLRRVRGSRSTVVW